MNTIKIFNKGLLKFHDICYNNVVVIKVAPFFEGGILMGRSLTGKELGKGIYQSKDGRFLGRFVNRFGETVCIRTTNLTELRKKMTDAKYQDYAKKSLANPNMTVKEWFNIWLETYEVNLRDSTRHNYVEMFEKMEPDIGDVKMKDLSLTKVQKTLNSLSSDQYRKRARSLLHSMFEKAIDDCILDRNPARKAQWNVRRDPKIKRQALTINQERFFVEYIYKPRFRRSHIEQAPILEFILETGLRIGEAMGLQWKYVHLEEGYFEVVSNLVTTPGVDENGEKLGRFRRFHYPKTENGKRKVPLTKRAKEILEEQKVRDRQINKSIPPMEGFEDLVFVTWNNTPLYDDTIRRALRVVCAEIQKIDIDFPAVTPHILRHTFATRCFERGMNMKTLQCILGHSNYKTTMDVYVHSTDDAMYEEIKKFETRYEGESDEKNRTKTEPIDHKIIEKLVK